MSQIIDFVLEDGDGAKVKGRVLIGNRDVAVVNERGDVARLVTVEDVASAVPPAAEPVASEAAPAPEASVPPAPAPAPEV